MTCGQSCLLHVGIPAHEHAGWESFNNHRDGVIQKGIGSRVKKAQTDESQNVIAFGRVLT